MQKFAVQKYLYCYVESFTGIAGSNLVLKCYKIPLNVLPCLLNLKYFAKVFTKDF